MNPTEMIIPLDARAQFRRERARWINPVPKPVRVGLGMGFSPVSFHS